MKSKPKWYHKLIAGTTGITIFIWVLYFLIIGIKKLIGLLFWKYKKQTKEIRQCPRCKGKDVCWDVDKIKQAECYYGKITNLLKAKKIYLECANCYYKIIYLPREGKLIDGEKK